MASLSDTRRAAAERRRPKLQHLLFLAFLLSGIIPLGVAAWLLVSQNREVLENQERLLLVTEAQGLSSELSGYLAGMHKQLALAGYGLLASGEAGDDLLRSPQAERTLRALSAENPGELVTLRILDRRGEGPQADVGRGGRTAEAALAAGFREALARGRTAYRFARLEDGEPVAALAVPLAAPPAAAGRPVAGTAEVAGEPVLVVEALVRLRAIDPMFRAESGPRSGMSAALVGGDGRILWTSGLSPEAERALAGSWVLADFAHRPLNVIGQYPMDIGDTRREMLVQVSPIEEAGWGLVAQKPLSAAFVAADRLVFNTVVSTLLLVLLSLLFALTSARHVSGQVRRLAATSHQIADGSFDSRVELEGMTFAEVAELAGDFNRMSERLAGYVEDLQRAARTNRELFIGSLRAFAAAIDAKDPYTRGHSERVATLSRTIARRLGQSEATQHRVWVGALLHDIGKIGVDDRILKKGGVLSAQEFEEMKAHPVIGAEILSPIAELTEMIPAVRWHHESWDGRGYPDALAGERIPLLARIVAVADTFDALTTNRPYQQAYGLDESVATIRRLVGSRFDAKVVSAFLSAYERGEVEMPPPRPAVVRRAAAGAV